jgi:hypothetical protein
VQTGSFSPGGTPTLAGSPVVPQMAGGGGNFPITNQFPSNDYSTGQQLVRTWSYVGGSDTNNPGWGGRHGNIFYSIATESTGVTFTTPTRVTIVNTSYIHINPVGNSQGWCAPQHMLGGGTSTLGYFTKDRDFMADAEGFLTCMTALPADLWENIDESNDFGSWQSAFGQPDNDVNCWGDGGLLRLCDGTFASPANTSSPWVTGGGGGGHGLWINTVSDSLPGNIPVWDGWRNDPQNVTTRTIDICLIGVNTLTSVAGVPNTRTALRAPHALPLAARSKDTATKFLVFYWSMWPSAGQGYYEMRITGQPGDLDYDGKCDFNDLPLFSATFNKSPGQAGYNRDADLNGDNVVDFNDLPAFSGAFGGTCQ